jgi:hypothetical protein
VTQQRIGQTEVSFRVLEIDRIDLVRHRRRADLASLELLPEETERDITPQVTVQVDQNQVGAGKGVEQFRHGVVRLDLNGIGIELQAQRFDEATRQTLPVKIRVSARWAL